MYLALGIATVIYIAIALGVSAPHGGEGDLLKEEPPGIVRTPDRGDDQPGADAGIQADRDRLHRQRGSPAHLHARHDRPPASPGRDRRTHIHPRPSGHDGRHNLLGFVFTTFIDEPTAANSWPSCSSASPWTSVDASGQAEQNCQSAETGYPMAGDAQSAGELNHARTSGVRYVNRSEEEPTMADR
jgi:hypothetical protein